METVIFGSDYEPSYTSSFCPALPSLLVLPCSACSNISVIIGSSRPSGIGLGTSARQQNA